MDKRERFKSYAGLILGKLDSALPERVNMLPSKLVIDFGEPVTKESVSFCIQTLDWLQENNYFVSPTRGRAPINGDIAELWYDRMLLTDKGLAALDQEMDFRGQWQRVGDILSNQANTAASETRNAILSDLAGRALGSFVKSVMGGA